MRIVNLFAALALSSAVAAPAIAQTAAISRGALVISSDGKRLAKIDRINKDASGNPVSAALILDGTFVYLPYSSLSAGENGRVNTSLSKADARKLDR